MKDFCSWARSSLCRRRKCVYIYFCGRKSFSLRKSVWSFITVIFFSSTTSSMPWFLCFHNLSFLMPSHPVSSIFILKCDTCNSPFFPLLSESASSSFEGLWDNKRCFINLFWLNVSPSCQHKSLSLNPAAKTRWDNCTPSKHIVTMPNLN